MRPGSERTPGFTQYSVDPAWAPDGRFVVYSGADVGTTFSVKAVTVEAAAHPLPAMTLTRDTWPFCLGSDAGAPAWGPHCLAIGRRENARARVA
jgi:hypothetical protein